MGKKIKYRKGQTYFESNCKNIDHDEKYNTPEREQEWEDLRNAHNAQFPRPENLPAKTLEEKITEVIYQLIEDDILKPGNNYEPPEE